MQSMSRSLSSKTGTSNALHYCGIRVLRPLRCMQRQARPKGRADVAAPAI